MFNWIKSLFAAPTPDTPEVVAAKDYNEARLDLLRAQKEREYWVSQVSMVQERISRLSRIVQVD